MTTVQRQLERGCAALAGALAVFLTAAAPAAAEPLDLGNPEPRAVTVRFEVSPADRPGQIDTVYGPELEAWLEPDAETASVRVTIPADVVERHIVHEHHPIPGTFSDFVWVFDPATGHVHSARMRGTVVRHLDWGIAKTRAKARLSFDMSTFTMAGFRKPRSVLGQPVNYFCEPESRRDCRPVAPRRYDPMSGYVMAVGPIDVANPVLGMQTFSTLGEAVFSERPPAGELEGESLSAGLGVPALLRTQR